VGPRPKYDCIKALSETDLTEDLKKITVPVLVMHSEDDQIVPFADSELLFLWSPSTKPTLDLSSLAWRRITISLIDSTLINTS
jgi:pimeloyl-ACP methyl ester carboxylesterase